MEKNPQSERSRYVNVLAHIDCDDFRQQIAAAESLLPDTDTEYKLPSEPLEVLDELLGAGGDEEVAVFRGVAFPLDDKDRLMIDDPKMLIDTQLTFGGANFYEVDEKWRILFEFRDELIEPNVAYAVPFEAILRLDVEKPSIDEILERHANKSKVLTSDPDFLASSADEQLGFLKTAAVACHAEILPYLGTEEISVECYKFYKHPDKIDEDKFTVDEIDQTECEFEERTAVVGEVIGVIYLEVLLGQPLPFNRSKDFRCGGVPCLVVRNDNRPLTTFVPIDQIERIESND